MANPCIWFRDSSAKFSLPLWGSFWLAGILIAARMGISESFDLGYLFNYSYCDRPGYGFGLLYYLPIPKRKNKSVSTPYTGRYYVSAQYYSFLNVTTGYLDSNTRIR